MSIECGGGVSKSGEKLSTWYMDGPLLKKAAIFYFLSEILI